MGISRVLASRLLSRHAAGMLLEDEAPTWVKLAAIGVVAGSFALSLPPWIELRRFEEGKWEQAPAPIVAKMAKEGIGCAHPQVRPAKDTWSKPVEQREFLLACASETENQWSLQVIKPGRPISSATIKPAAFPAPPI